MKAAMFLLATGCLLIGSCKGAGEPPGENGRAVEIVLQDVTVRQYSRQKQRFEFEAPRLRLDQEAEVIEAPAGVRGRIEAGAFSKKVDDK